MVLFALLRLYPLSPSIRGRLEYNSKGHHYATVHPPVPSRRDPALRPVVP